MTDADLLAHGGTFVVLPEGQKAAPAKGSYGQGVALRLSPEERQRKRGDGSQLGFLCGGERVQMPDGTWRAIVVVDIDTKPAWTDPKGKEHPAQQGEATITKACEMLGDLPDTLACRTASGGFQLYYWAPTDLVFPPKVLSSRMGMGGGVEIQNDGQYVVFPGGHVSDAYAAAERAKGRSCVAGRYKWIDPTARIAELSAAWVEALRKHAKKEPTTTSGGPWTPVPLYTRRPDPRLANAATYLTGKAKLSIEGEGGRNVAFGVCGTLARLFRLPLDVARELILTHYNPRLVAAGTTEWQPEEIDERLSSAALTSSIPIADCQTEEEAEAFEAGFAASAVAPAPSAPAPSAPAGPPAGWLPRPRTPRAAMRRPRSRMRSAA